MATVQENSPAFMLWCVEGDGKDVQTLAALNRVGNNLNQLARNTNRGTDIDVPQLRDALHQYHAVIAAIYEALGMESARDNQGQKPGGR